MRSIAIACLSLLATVGISASAAAQTPSTYVSVLLAGDIVRGTHIDDDAFPVLPGLRHESDDAALAILVRAGTPIGKRWGVEFEAGFGGAIESVQSYDVSVFAFTRPSAGLFIDGFPDGFLPPPFAAYEVRTAERRATIGASVWTRREIGERAGLTFLGGLVFSRVRTEATIDFDNPFALSIVPGSHESTAYGVGPMAGIETDVRLTDSLSLSAGVRLHSENAVGSAWVIRPAAGLRWNF